jgi:ketosteroid isomerase-like protein
MTAQDLTSVIEQSHQALDAILRGDASGYRALFSQADDVTLGNPFGPYARGRKDVEVRVTSVFRKESGGWKLVHRHADPITTPRPASSVVSS